jgi:hypothetical protein
MHITWAGFKLTFSMGIGTDCISSCKFNYHTITTAPNILMNKVLKILCKGIVLYPIELLQPKLHCSWLVERSPNYTTPDWWQESLEETTYAISAYPHWKCEFESRSGDVYSTQHYMIKFVNDLQQISGFLQILPFSPPIKTYHHDIAEILLKVALKNFKQQTSIKLNLSALHNNSNVSTTIFSKICSCIYCSSQYTNVFENYPWQQQMKNFTRYNFINHTLKRRLFE